MKYKYIIFISLLFLCMPIIANADVAPSKCSVISGNLTTIGSEVACGDEHFYIIENNNGTIKMMAKYNLYVGGIYEKVNLDSSQTYAISECDEGNIDECYVRTKYYFKGEEISNRDSFINKIKDELNLDYISDLIYDFPDSYNKKAYFIEVPGEKYTEGGVTYQKKAIKVYPYTIIKDTMDGYALQNELAKGVTGDKGNANYPIYSTTTIFSSNPIVYGEDIFHYSYFFNSIYETEEGYTNFEFKDDNQIRKYLNDYNLNMINKGYIFSNVDMITMDELSNLVNSITGSPLPLSDWYNSISEGGQTGDELGQYYPIGDLKQFLSDDYSWIWNTSYWTKTIAGSDITLDTSLFSYWLYFVSSAGDVCLSQSDCFGGIPRAGIRPIVTISMDNVIDPFNIETQTEGSGSVEVVNKAMADEQITFRAIPEKNYKIKYVIVTDKLGNSVTFKEDQLIQNNDGTISINSFTMPSSDVVIKVGFELINPKTGVSNPIWIMILGLIVSGLAYYELNKNSKTNMEL